MLHTVIRSQPVELSDLKGRSGLSSWPESWSGVLGHWS